jgi:hypothetical protein
MKLTHRRLDEHYHLVYKDDTPVGFFSFEHGREPRYQATLRLGGNAVYLEADTKEELLRDIRTLVQERTVGKECNV